MSIDVKGQVDDGGKVSGDEFFEFCVEEYRRDCLLVNPEGIFTLAFVDHLNELFRSKELKD